MSDMSLDVDVCVIGAGSGGLRWPQALLSSEPRPC